MKSKVAQKIMEETPEEVKSSARLYADKLMLENKIRESLTGLKEIGAGLKFTDELGFKAEIIYENVGTYYYFSESDNEIFSVSSNFFGGICKEVIGHPIKLNDVLEYLLDFRKYSTKDSQIQKVLNVWDLSSVFLADQSEEFINFLNEL